MNTDSIHRSLVRRVMPAALLVTALLFPIAGRAEPPSAPTTFGECYKSAHSCQKSRCKALDGQEQVKCMQQCNREYESCTSHATSGGPVGGTAEPTAGKERRHRRDTKAGQGD